MRRSWLGLSLIASILLVSNGVGAQKSTESSTQPLPTPEQTSAAAVVALNPGLPTVFIVGDSTARNQADLGWGDHFSHYFDINRINVANRAIAGRSSRTFIREGAWNKVLAEMRPGDFVLIQLSHNDGGDLDGPKPRGSIKGTGDQSQIVTLQNGQLETVHTYGWYLRKYIADTRAKRATPILLTLTVRNIWKMGEDGKSHIERDMGYTGAIQEIAAEQQVANGHLDLVGERVARGRPQIALQLPHALGQLAAAHIRFAQLEHRLAF